jgi:hypothetical protein
LSVEIRTHGFGLVVLDQPVSREALEKAQAEIPPLRPTPESPPQSALWLTLPDGTHAAVDWDVTRFLPDHLVKVYTMSSRSAMLEPGIWSGSALIAARAEAPFAADDWSLQPGETEEKQSLAEAFFARYQPEDLAEKTRARGFYQLPAKLSTPAKGRSQSDAQVIATLSPDAPAKAPRLHPSAPTRLVHSVPVTVLGAGHPPSAASLPFTEADLTTLKHERHIPLGNYNYDAETLRVLARPNELPVTAATGVDLFVLAQNSLGLPVAAVELVCYNGFTSNLTAPGQGLLIIPPDGDLAAALAAREGLLVSHDETTVIALRRPGASPAESAAGVMGINILLP